MLGEWVHFITFLYIELIAMTLNFDALALTGWAAGIAPCLINRKSTEQDPHAPRMVLLRDSLRGGCSRNDIRLSLVNELH